MHPASLRAASDFLTGLRASVDLGLVYPPRAGEARGRGLWYGHAIGSAAALLPLLNRAAAGNCMGAAVFVRVHVPERGDDAPHPGVILLDDLDFRAVDAMERDGLPGSAVVETSPRNCQVWVRIAREGEITRSIAVAAARHLAAHYGGDLRAVGSSQPGRLPGFTNRKPKYASPDGRFPYVRLIKASPDAIGSGARPLLETIRGAASRAQPARAGAPENPPRAGESSFEALNAIRAQEAHRIAREVACGSRPPAAGSASEIDFAAVTRAMGLEFREPALEHWLRTIRPEHHASYAARTIASAKRFLTPVQGSSPVWPK